MNAAAERLEFAPPKQPGLLRGFALAVLAHLLLVAGLMQAVQWKRDAQEVAVEAELWSAVPQQAAPREVAPPPPPPQPVVKAPPEPVVKAPLQPDPQVQRDAQIALERERQKQERELERRELEKRKLVEQRAKLEAQKKKQREEELAKKKLEQQKQVAEAKRKEDEKKRKQQEQEARETKRVAELREENMRRIQGMAGKGAPSSTGAAPQSSGPSASWAGRVQSRVRPNIVFTDDISGNPKAEVEVRTARDGTIISRRLVRSSGVKSWDEAVLRALDKTEVLPPDVDGRVPSPVIIDFRPRG
jgi:colicin import membrane protein